MSNVSSASLWPIVYSLDRAQLEVRTCFQIRGNCALCLRTRLNWSSVLEIVFTFICELDEGKGDFAFVLYSSIQCLPKGV